MAKVFVLAPPALASKCRARAGAWYGEPKQTMFSSCRTAAVGAVAEFLANEKGFTLFESSATYPKKED